MGDRSLKCSVLDSEANFIPPYRDTTALRAVEPLKKSPPPGPRLREPGEVFRIVKIIRISRPHDSRPGIDSCCTVTPFPGLPVGSNTETDDDCRRRQFSIGKLSVRKLPLRPDNNKWDCGNELSKREKRLEGLSIG